MNEIQEIPLFPLNVVLFPACRLNLQIFEQRYIDLVSWCMRNQTGFGICLLKSGDEVVRASGRQTIHRIGTYCQIVDWDQLENGLLGITVQGTGKFQVEDCWQADSGVLRAKVLFSAEDNRDSAAVPISEDYDGLVDLLQSLASHPMVTEQGLAIDYEDLREVGWRLGELLPVENPTKQELLEVDDPHERLRVIEELVANLANNSRD